VYRQDTLLDVTLQRQFGERLGGLQLTLIENAAQDRESHYRGILEDNIDNKK
jgi:hypothetical protein